MADGTVYIDTEINSDGFGEAFDGYSKDIKEAAAKTITLKRQVSALNEEYKKNSAEIKSLSEELTHLTDRQKLWTEMGFAQDSNQFVELKQNIDSVSAALENAKAKQEEMEISMQAVKIRSDMESKSLNKLMKEEGKAAEKTKTLKEKLDSVKNAFKKFGSMVKKLANNMHLFGKSTKSAGTSLKKMVGYALGIRSIYAAVRKAVEYVKEGMNNLVQYSGETNSSMSALKSSLTQLKNSLAAAFAPILNMIAPILTKFIDMLSEVTSKVGAFFSALSGKNTYTKAIAVQEDYADSLNNTADSAKNAQKYLSGLDEIKTFTEAETTSEAISAEDMFVEEEIDSPILSFADKIKEVIENIKALFKSEDWKGLGSYITDGLIKGIEKLVEILKVIKWENLGNIVAEFFNGIDWVGLISKITSVASELTKVALDLVIGFAEQLDWKKLGSDFWNSLVGIVTNIDWGGIVAKAFELLGAAVGGVAGLIVGFAQSLWETLKTAFEDTKSYFTSYIEEAGGNTALGLLKGIIDAFKNIGTWIKEHIFTPFIEGFKKAFGIHSPSTVMEKLGGFIMQGLINGVANLFNKFKNVFENIKNLIISIFTKIKEKVTSIWDGIVSVIKGAVNGIIGVINGLISGIINGINGMINALNNLSFDVPDWVPLIGGEKFGFDIPNLTAPKTPYLATGAVIPPNAPFMAVLGDQKHGTNIEAPLDTIKQAVREVVGNGSGGGMYSFSAQINRRVLFEEMIEEAKLRQTTSGKNPFDLKLT